ncbi:MAG: hypothetical protein ACKOQ4_14350 [Mycobacterium sp.]
MRLADALGEVMPVRIEDDGALTVRHDGTVASLRLVTVAEGLELVSLTAILGWDLPLTAELRERVAAQASRTMLGTVMLSEQPGRRADLVLRYNFPAGDLGVPALQTLVLMVLAGGGEAARAVAG